MQTVISEYCFVGSIQQNIQQKQELERTSGRRDQHFRWCASCSCSLRVTTYILFGSINCPENVQLEQINPSGHDATVQNKKIILNFDEYVDGKSKSTIPTK